MFELGNYVACICEGGAEEAIINILLDSHLLIFEREQLIDEKVIRTRDAASFERKYLRMGFEGKITVFRILDSRRENFRLSKAYQHTKAMRKLRSKSISAWYLEGYEASARRYFEGKGWQYRERVAEKEETISGTDYCMRLGISLKQFDALFAAGIETVFDLVVASGNENWHKPIKGIGPKTAQDLLDKLDRLFISGLDHTGDDEH